MTKIKVACIQMDISLCKKKENITKAFSMAEKAIIEGAELIVFPEVFTTGFCYEKMEEIAETAPYPSIEGMSDLSRDNNCIIIGSIIEKQLDENEQPLYYNLGFCIENGEIAGTYRKTHPFGKEKKYFSAGQTIQTIDLKDNGISIGFEICYEIRFPEVARKLTLLGADILVTIAEFPSPRGNIWKTLATARAIENQIPHIACNRAGSDPDTSYFGGSIIIDSIGDIKAEARDEECIIMHEIDVEKKKDVRNSIPVFDDRHEELY